MDPYVYSTPLPPSPGFDHTVQPAIDVRPDGFANLRRAMDPSPPASPVPFNGNDFDNHPYSPRPPPGRTLTGVSSPGGSSGKSSFSRAVSFLKGVAPLKATLQRPFTECRAAVHAKLDELGVAWSEPRGTGVIACEYGARGTADWVRFTIGWVTNGATAAPLPGADMWYTKITVARDAGSGQAFREVGKPVLNAAKYVVRGGVYYDYSVTTWGLY
ncbi:hypothetical protein F5Y15DRAFT_424993 [Xylariaceae sp. FL0016]|nr:hypothetical protein F5Y15DRAFT_424993 [Xylariaceae sp. FL0016]